jgi:hypothetical protein
MAQAAKKLVVCGGNGFLGAYESLPSPELAPSGSIDLGRLTLFRKPHLQGGSISRLERDFHKV